MRSGEWSALLMASLTRCSPSPQAVEMIAVPLSFRIVFTSWKSTLMKHSSEIISDMERAALASVSSAFSKALKRL